MDILHTGYMVLDMAQGMAQGMVLDMEPVLDTDIPHNQFLEMPMLQVLSPLTILLQMVSQSLHVLHDALRGGVHHDGLHDVRRDARHVRHDHLCPRDVRHVRPRMSAMTAVSALFWSKIRHPCSSPFR